MSKGLGISETWDGGIGQEGLRGRVVKMKQQGEKGENQLVL